MPESVVYLDSFYLIGNMWGEDPEYRASDAYGNLIGPVGRGEARVCIPQIVIGEVMVKMREEVPETEWRRESVKLLRIIDRLKGDLVSATPDCYEIASYISTNDPHLKDSATDVLTVAQALCDRGSSILLIPEIKVHESLVIEDIQNRMVDDGKREHKLSIRGTYKKS